MTLIERAARALVALAAGGSDFQPPDGADHVCQNGKRLWELYVPMVEEVLRVQAAYRQPTLGEARHPTLFDFWRP